MKKHELSGIHYIGSNYKTCKMMGCKLKLACNMHFYGPQALNMLNARMLRCFQE